MRFDFILVEKANYPVAALCRNLEVTRQGFYAYVKRRPSQRAEQDQRLRREVLRLFNESHGTYGSPRILRDLFAMGIRTSKRRVERLMKEMGLQARQPKRFVRTTLVDENHAFAANTLDRNFTADAPNQRWVADITYIHTDEGWVYLATVLDLFSRAIVGWALDDDLSAQLPLRALNNALVRRAPEAGLLHHSDRGCQYTSKPYQDALAEAGIAASMSRTGNCWDNAVAESLFATIKVELIHRQRWESKAQLRRALFQYIEVFYNRQRRHSSLDYKTPAQVEEEHLRAA